MSKRKIILIVLLLVLFTGYLLPENIDMPVHGADRNSYHPQSFWFYPWGKSGAHKGVDIFAKKGTVVSSSSPGLVVYSGNIEKGGNMVLVLGPKWRIHYYAHLDEINVSTMSWSSRKEKIGTVGTTGNAAGKPPHLHYSIITLIPYPWRIDSKPQGWKKMFYLNPIEYIQ